MESAHDGADHQGQPGQAASGNQGERARRWISLAEIGEHVEADDDAEDADREQVGCQVGARQETDQVFAGVDDRALPSGMTTSWESRSSGTGKTITVLRSTPISVSVCR